MASYIVHDTNTRVCCELQFNDIYPTPFHLFVVTMAMFCICGMCIPYSSLIPILMMLWRPLKQWFDQFFGTTQPDDKLKNKKENKTTVEDSDCSSGCCKPNTTGVTTPNTTDAASVTAADALFQKSNKISLHEDDSSRFDALIASEHPTCVKFTASWCKPCQQQEPEMVQLAQKMAETGSHMRFVSVDVDVHDELFASLEIVGIPHIRLYQRSEMLETFTGRSTADLEKACAVLGKKNQ